MIIYDHHMGHKGASAGPEEDDVVQEGVDDVGLPRREGELRQLRRGDARLLRAVREEGVSFHYAPPSEIARANGIATRTLISAAHNSSRAVHTGSVWTTDALYREFTGKIRTFANQGVLGVDMETSALMIVAAFRRVELGIILTVSDLVYRNDWPNIFGTDVYQDNCVHMADIVMQAIGELLETTGRV